MNEHPLLDTKALDFFIELHGGLSGQLRATASEELNEIASLADRLVQACRQADADSARRHAHDLTGFAAAYGLDRMARLAEALGCAFRGSDMERVALLADRLAASTQPSIAAAREALGIG